MAFMTVNGTNIELIKFQEEEPERAGTWGRAFDNGMYSQLRSSKRHWSGTTMLMDYASINTLKTNTANDTPITVTNNPDSNSISAMVRVNAVHDFTATGGGVLRYVDLDIREV
jgi:hypothetical protein